jgi:hypothetical protein
LDTGEPRVALAHEFRPDQEAVPSPGRGELCQAIGYRLSAEWTKFRSGISIGFAERRAKAYAE